MENKVELESSVETPILLENPIVSEQKTPLTPIQLSGENAQSSPISGIDLKKPSTPDRLKVPKAFKFPERYRSPTDSMMSPVTKGLLARARKSGAILPPSLNQLKVQEFRIHDVGFVKEINN